MEKCNNKVVFNPNFIKSKLSDDNENKKWYKTPVDPDAKEDDGVREFHCIIPKEEWFEDESN